MEEITTNDEETGEKEPSVKTTQDQNAKEDDADEFLDVVQHEDDDDDDDEESVHSLSHQQTKL